MWAETKERLEEERMSLLTKIVGLGLERDKLRKQIKNHETFCGTFCLNLDKLNKEKAALKKENDELKEGRTRIRERFNDLYAENCQLHQKASVADDIYELKTELYKQQVEHAIEKSKKDQEYKLTLDSMESFYAGVVKVKDAVIESLNKKQEELEALLADCRLHVDKRRESLMNQRTENENLHDRLKNSGANILHLSQQLYEQKVEVKRLRQTLENVLSNHKIEKDDLEKQLLEADDLTSYLRDKVAAVKEMHHACLHRYDNLNEKGEINMSQIEELETKIAKLERQVETRNKTLRDVVEAHREFRAELQDMIEQDNEVYRFFNERFAKLSGFAATKNEID